MGAQTISFFQGEKTLRLERVQHIPLQRARNSFVRLELAYAARRSARNYAACFPGLPQPLGWAQAVRKDS